jgi:hypothetical protein
LKEVCTEGHADRTQIWADLTPIERQQFQSLLVLPPLACEAGQKNQRGGSATTSPLWSLSSRES